MVWTRFMDMHSGGGSKEDFEYLYIEAPQAEAELVFYNRFGHNPYRVTCTCCGEDYSITEEPTLEVATAYERGCDWDDEAEGYVERPNTRRWAREYVTLDQYLAQPGVAVIRAEDIKPEERIGTLPRQGYVWID